MYHNRTINVICRFTPTGVGTIEKGRFISSSYSVHPHGRGDNSSVSVDDALMRGSPPRAWGQCSAG